MDYIRMEKMATKSPVNTSPEESMIGQLWEGLYFKQLRTVSNIFHCLIYHEICDRNQTTISVFRDSDHPSHNFHTASLDWTCVGMTDLHFIAIHFKPLSPPQVSFLETALFSHQFMKPLVLFLKKRIMQGWREPYMFLTSRVT